MNGGFPSTFAEALEYFSNPETCIRTISAAKWPHGPHCPECGNSRRLSYLSKRRIWVCLECRKQFSVRVDTILEDSPIPLRKWLCVIWMLANSEGRVSSYDVARALEVTQKTGWFMLHRLRHALGTGASRRTDTRIAPKREGRDESIASAAAG